MFTSNVVPVRVWIVGAIIVVLVIGGIFGVQSISSVRAPRPIA